MAKKEDLGIKIGSKEEAMWQKTIDGLEQEIKITEETLKVSKVFLAVAYEQLEIEKKKRQK